MKNVAVKNYFEDVKKMKPAAQQLSFPIKEVAAPEELVQFIYKELLPRIGKREKIYVHCLNGHGRTGIVVSCLIGLLYGVSGGQALNYNEKFHSARREESYVGSPETLNQRLQVFKVVDELCKKNPPAVVDYDDSLGNTVVAIDTYDEPSTQTNLSLDLNSLNSDSGSVFSSAAKSPSKPEPPVTPKITSARSTVSQQSNLSESDALDSARSQMLTPKPIDASIAPMATDDDETVLGPFPNSNWVIKNQVLCGAFPMVNSTSTDRLETLLKLGITTFISLQEEVPVIARKNSANRTFINVLDTTRYDNIMQRRNNK